MHSEHRAHANKRLAVLRAIHAAQQRHSEVMATIAATRTHDEAYTAVGNLLDLTGRDEITSVLDMQLRRFPHEQIERIANEITELTAALEP